MCNFSYVDKQIKYDKARKNVARAASCVTILLITVLRTSSSPTNHTSAITESHHNRTRSVEPGL